MNTKNTLVPARHDYKLFETNDIAKYGIMPVAGKMLSPIAYKALMYLIWKWVSSWPKEQTDDVPDPGVPTDVNLTISELGNALGYDKEDGNRNFARDVKKVCRAIGDIMSRPLTIYDAKENKAVTFVWLCLVEYDFKADRMHVQFTPGLANYFGKWLRKEFTVVKLKYLNRLSISAAVILYPFFCRYIGMAKFNYSVSDLAVLLMGDSEYPYKYLKNKVLLPAIEQINERTDISVSFEENKTSRKVSSLSITVKEELAFDEERLLAAYFGYDLAYALTNADDDRWMDQYHYDVAKQEYVKKCAESGSR